MSDRDQPRRGPVVIEYEDAGTERHRNPPHGPAEAPPVPEMEGTGPNGQAMQVAARLGARRMSRPARLLLGAALALLVFVVSLATWDYVSGLLARNAVLGWAAVGLVTLVLLGLVTLGLREAAAYARLRRLDDLRRQSDAALNAADLGGAARMCARLDALYSARPELERGRERFVARRGDIFDAAALIGLAEVELMAPLDAEARREVEVAARQVATITAFVPLALADVVAALVANLRMIRRIAEIYGGRAGVLGGWRLTRAVLTHLVATGAVAVGDDMIGSLAGGGLLSKVSRRFGEGVVNGALTARVGVAAMEVCRPVGFRELPAPRVTNLLRRALAGLFDRG